MRKVLLLAVFLGLIISASAQVATFQGNIDEYWDVGGNWSTGTPPTSTNTTQIIVPSGFLVRVRTNNVTADQMTIEADGAVLVESGGVLQINDGTGNDLTMDDSVFPATFTPGALTVDVGGVLINVGQFAAIPQASTFYTVNGEYRHQQNGNAIPVATWSIGSTCRINGWVALSTGPTMVAFRNSISQPFYNFIWDSGIQPGINPTGQTAANVALEGLLGQLNPSTNEREIFGDLIINNTNSRRVQLGFSAVNTGVLRVYGNFDVGTLAKIVVGSSGTFTVNVNGNSTFAHSSSPAPTAPANAYSMTAAGTTVLNIAGNFTLGGNGQLNMAPASGPATINIGGDFTMSGGQVSKSSTGVGTIAFDPNLTHNYTFTSGSFDATAAVIYSLGSNATLNLGTAALGSTGGTFNSDGTVVLGSFNAAGALAGNIPCNTRTFTSGTIIYRSTGGGQFIGTSHPGTSAVATTIDNASGVSLASAVTIGGLLTLQNGNLNIGSNTLTLAGTLAAGINSIAVTTNSNLTINGTGAFGTLPLSGTSLNNFTTNRTSTGSISLGTDMTIGGTFTQTAGRVDIGAHTLTINAAYTGTGNLGTTASSLLVINQHGSPLPTVAFTNNPINTLTLNRSGATLATTGILTATNLNLSEGVFNPASFNMASGGLVTVIAGSIIPTPGGAGMYNVVYNNASPITGSGEIPPAIVNNRLNNVTILGGSSVDLPNDCVINGVLNINNGSLDAQTNSITLLGNFIGDSGGALTTSTFTFDGNTTISGSSIPDFGNVILNGSRTLSLPAQLNIAGDIQFAAGATLNHNSGTVSLTGTGTQTIGGGGLTLFNLTANKSNGSDVILSSALNLTGALNITAVATDFASNGFLTVRSTTDAASGNGRIGQLLGGATVSGDVIVERYMSTEGRIFRHVSAPVSGHTVAALQLQGIPVTGTFSGASTGCAGCTTNPSMLTFNVTTNAFVQFPPTANTQAMAAGEGYLLFIRQDVIGNSNPVNINYTGPVNQGDYPLTLTHNGTLPQSWSLVGNPYPASIDWDINLGWSKTNVAGSIAVQDSPMGGYRYWNGSVGSGIGTGLDNGEIAKGQAFWVRTNASPSLTIHEQAKISATAPFYKEAAPDPDAIIINITDTRGLVDRAAFQVHEAGKPGLDDLDAPKLANTWLDLSTRNSGSDMRMAINVIDKISCESPVAIDMTFTKNTNGTFVITPTGSYTFKFGVLGSKWAGRTVKLIDNYTSTTTDVTDGKEYSFSIVQATAASFAPTRFSLVFGDQEPSLNLAVNGDEVACLGGEANLTVATTQPGFKYYLTNGTTAVSQELEGNGSDLVFTVAASDLALGANTFTVMVKGLCTTKTLASSWAVAKQEMQKPASIDSQVCGAGKFALTATGAGSGDTYQWYESADATSAIGNEAILVTSVLHQSKIYYVSVRSQYGCESDRIAVNATVLNNPNAAIAVDKATLTSNSDTGNQWSFNDTAIEGATEKTFTATESGVYGLTVTNSNGCTTTVTTTYAKEVPQPEVPEQEEPTTPEEPEQEEPKPEEPVEVVTGDISEAVQGAKAYPNPVSDNLYIEVGNVSGPVNITLLNELGGSVRSASLSGQRSTSIPMHDLSGGVYFVKIAGGGAVKTIKVVKVSQ